VTEVGAGGVVIARWRKSKRFHKDYYRLAVELRDHVDQKLQDLTKDPRPPGLRFEKLKGYSSPDIYTIHVTGNYKLSMSIEGSSAQLRRVGTHDEIDRQP
jgi:mRNA-degrading endonuclease RelE of RelBE toxin-antitoxin system